MSADTPAGLLIFDLDGTLFNGRKATVGAVHQVFHDYGIIPPRAEKIVTWFGKPTAQFETWMASLCPEHVGREIAEKVIRREVEHLADEGELIPGVEQALRRLKEAGHTMAICSNGGRRYVHLALESCGILSHFKLIRWRMKEDDRKPLMAKEILDKIDARPAAVIGDRHDDVEAARENQVFAVGAGYGFGAREELAEAHRIIEGADELPGVIDSLFRGGP